ncbi:MAG TPA: hypothetical protein VK629_17335, partial [Steroidobacteraceae bacterium]|nr:hypothetical protein [Steroidobacteraceae bacterium]
RARALKIDETKLIYIWGGAAAMEPRDYLARDQYHHSDAQDVVLSAMQSLAHANDSTLDAWELYSCFPCVPKMTRRVLDLSDQVTPTVTGGLSLFGAPLNNYMTHAACAMVRHLRADRAHTGLLYGQGEIVTKHHGLVVGRIPPTQPLAFDYSVQPDVDRQRGSVPATAADYRGKATLETFSVVYDREAALHGTVIARTQHDNRIMARMTDRDDIGRLQDSARSPIGLRLNIVSGGDLLHARFG